MQNTKDRDLVCYSEERNIEIIYNNVEEATNDLLLAFLDESYFESSKFKIMDQFRRKLQIINKTYWSTKEQFKYTKRDSWERYFDHVSWVLDIYIKKISNLKNELDELDNTQKEECLKAMKLVQNEIELIATCLDHDTIEDTNISFDWLSEISWEKIAFTTLLLSKRPIWRFIINKDELEDIEWINNEEELKKYLIDLNIKKKTWELEKLKRPIWRLTINKDELEDIEWINNEEELKKYLIDLNIKREMEELEKLKWLTNFDDFIEFIEIERSWVLNSKGLVCDKIKTKYYIEENITDVDEKISIMHDYEITDYEREYTERYYKLSKKYKQKRNDEYLEHLESGEALKKYAIELAEEKWLNFYEEEIDIIVNNVMKIKIADRLHNLSDIAVAWKNQPERINAKLMETEAYLLSLALELGKHIHDYIKSEISKIREAIFTDGTSEYVGTILNPI